MAVNTGWRGGSIPVGACRFAAEGRMASIGPSALGAKGCVEGVHRFAQGGRWAPFKEKGRQYDKTIQPGYRPKENKPNSLCSLENHTTALTGEEKAAPPLVAGATTFPPLKRWDNKTFATALRAWKTIQPPFGRGNAPLSPPTAVLPPEGEVLTML